EPTPQPLPAPRQYSPAQSWFLEHKKALAVVATAVLLVLFVIGHHATTTNQPTLKPQPSAMPPTPRDLQESPAALLPRQESTGIPAIRSGEPPEKSRIQ